MIHHNLRRIHQDMSRSLQSRHEALSSHYYNFSSLSRQQRLHPVSPVRIFKILAIFALIFSSHLQFSKAQTSSCLTRHYDTCYNIITEKKTKKEAETICTDKHKGKLLELGDSGQTSWIDGQLMKTFKLTRIWLGYEQHMTDWRFTRTGRYLENQGCWRDGGNPRDLDGKFVIPPTDHAIASITHNNQFTPSLCIEKCKREGYPYAGVQAGYFCYCGSKYGKYTRTSGCTQKCSGDVSEYCGSSWKNYVIRIDGVYSSWIKAIPTDKGNCAMIDPYGSYNWRDVSCSTKLPSLCTIETLDSSDNINPTIKKKKQFWSSCIVNKNGLCFQYNKIKLTWAMARNACFINGGSLASIEDNELNNFAAGIVHKNFAGDAGAWIGLNNFRIINSKGFEQIYSNWQEKEPAYSLPDEKGLYKYTKPRCIVYERNGTTTTDPLAGWKIASCETKAQAICVSRYVTSTTSTTTTTTTTTSTTTTTTTTTLPSTSTTTTRSSSTPTKYVPKTNSRFSSNLPSSVSSSTSSVSGGSPGDIIANTLSTPSATAITSSTTPKYERGGGFWTTERINLAIYIGLGVGAIFIIVLIIAIISCIVLTRKRKRKAADGSHYPSGKSTYPFGGGYPHPAEVRLVEGSENNTPPHSDFGHPAVPYRTTSLHTTAVGDDETQPIPPERTTSLGLIASAAAPVPPPPFGGSNSNLTSNNQFDDRQSQVSTNATAF